MAVSIAAVMRQVRNFFVRGYMDGEFIIGGGVLTPEPPAHFVAITGSAFSDGVYSVFDGFPSSASGKFTGRVWLLHPPDDFLALCQQISAYDDQNPVGAMQSESFGEYSYTRAVGNSGAIPWQTAFAQQLAPYRRMFAEVDV